MTRKTRQTAAAAYREAYSSAHRALQELTIGMSALDRQLDAEQNGEVTWGDVGDVKSYALQLEELRDRLYQLGEYAPENLAASDRQVEKAKDRKAGFEVALQIEKDRLGIR